MNISKIRPVVLSLLLSLCAVSASAAAFSPLQIGGFGENFQLVDKHTPVIGLRLNLPLSGNDDVWGLDVGLISCAHDFTGLRLNAFSWTRNTLNGVDIALCDMSRRLNGIHVCGIGVVTQELCGLQAGLAPFAGKANGLQIGFFDFSEHLSGLQIGLCNYALELHGVQFGLLNFGLLPFEGYAPRTIHGLQIGLVNHAETLHGVQIGLLNFVTDSDYPCLPFLRASF